MLVWPIEVSRVKYQRDHSAIPRSDLFEFLESRKGKLDGVVITGGEPTLHPDLPDFLKDIRAMGFAIKLDSNGTNPEMLEQLIKDGMVDYLAMDIKAPLDLYPQVVSVDVNTDNIKRSIDIIKNSGLPYEFRSTLVPGLHTLEDIKEMGKLIQGADKWFLQFFKSDTPLVNQEMQNKSKFTTAEMEAMAEEGKKWVGVCEVRG